MRHRTIVHRPDRRASYHRASNRLALLRRASYGTTRTVVHHTVVHPTIVHCTVVHCTIVHCTVVHPIIALHCASYRRALYRHALHHYTSYHRRLYRRTLCRRKLNKDAVELPHCYSYNFIFCVKFDKISGNLVSCNDIELDEVELSNVVHKQPTKQL